MKPELSPKNLHSPTTSALPLFVNVSKALTHCPWLANAASISPVQTSFTLGAAATVAAELISNAAETARVETETRRRVPPRLARTAHTSSKPVGHLVGNVPD